VDLVDSGADRYQLLVGDPGSAIKPLRHASEPVVGETSNFDAIEFETMRADVRTLVEAYDWYLNPTRRIRG